MGDINRGRASGCVLDAAVVARCRCCDVGVVQVLWRWRGSSVFGVGAV